jgi:hypothetical protein
MHEATPYDMREQTGFPKLDIPSSRSFTFLQSGTSIELQEPDMLCALCSSYAGTGRFTTSYSRVIRSCPGKPY